MGIFGTEVNINQNGKRVLEFCIINELLIGNAIYVIITETNLISIWIRGWTEWKHKNEKITDVMVNIEGLKETETRKA